MKVGSSYRRGTISAASTEDLTQAACRMRFHDVGALLVRDRGEPVGILTERDVLRAVGDAADPDTTLVVTYMTPGPVTVTPETEISEAAATMLRIGARHLPVSEDGRIVGMISARDLLADEAWSEEAPR